MMRRRGATLDIEGGRGCKMWHLLACVWLCDQSINQRSSQSHTRAKEKPEDLID